MRAQRARTVRARRVRMVRARVRVWSGTWMRAYSGRARMRVLGEDADDGAVGDSTGDSVKREEKGRW